MSHTPPQTPPETERRVFKGEFKWPSNLPFASCKAFLLHLVNSVPGNVDISTLAMRFLQLQQIKISEKFYRDVYALEKKYYDETGDLYDLRKQIITGKLDNDDDADGGPQAPGTSEAWNSNYNKELEEIQNSPGFREILDSIRQIPTSVRGVPNFWLTIFRNVSVLSNNVQTYDEPLLKSLIDIRMKYDKDSYMFEFFFEPNDFLADDSVLTKKYYLRISADNENPFSFDGAEIYSCEGCTIMWREGKDLTVETELAAGAAVPRKSFFNFFTPPKVDDLRMADKKTKELLVTDFEIGYVLRTEIVPKAILFYTGDLLEDYNDAEEKTDLNVNERATAVAAAVGDAKVDETKQQQQYNASSGDNVAMGNVASK